MSDLTEYEILINDVPHTVLLSDEDARTRGLIETVQDGDPVDIEALVKERVEALTREYEEEFQKRVDARIQELDTEYAARVETAVEAALDAAAKDGTPPAKEQAATTKPPKNSAK